MASFKHKSTQLTVDLYSTLTSMERHVLFLESLLNKPLSQQLYQELLKAHFPIKPDLKN